MIARVTTVAALALGAWSSAGAQALRSDTKDIPVIEAPAAQPSRTIALFISGDGGWAGMTKTSPVHCENTASASSASTQ